MNRNEVDSLPAQFSLIQTKGTLDWAYASFILASTAAAMDKEVELFFSFYGLKCLLKDARSLKVSPLGRPDMIVQSPVGPQWLQRIDWNQKLPGLVWTLPGMAHVATLGFKKRMQRNGQLSIEELRSLCLDLGVKFTACQMTVDLMGLSPESFIDGVSFAGAPTYFAHTPPTQSLFI
jgi:peroxiredoxin family protein